MNSNKFLQLKMHGAINEQLCEDGWSWEEFYLSAYIVLLNKLYGWETLKILTQVNKKKIIKIELAEELSFWELCEEVSACLHKEGELADEPCDDREAQTAFLVNQQQSQVTAWTNKFSNCFVMECFKAEVGYSYQFRKMNTTKVYLSLMEERLEKISALYLADPKIKIRDISIIGAKEEAMIAGFARGLLQSIPHKTFHQMFEEQALRTPDKIAVVCGKNTISYLELNQRANQLANYIAEKAPGRENFIGICMGRSIEFVIAVLGIIKSGNAYVPIDQDTLNPGHSSSFPKSRLSFMLNDTKMKLVITKKAFARHIPDEDRQILCLDDDCLKEYASTDPQKYVAPHHLIYGIYTSGSTGFPKLTMVEHKSVINLFYSLQRYVYARLSEQDNHYVAQNAPFGFDASVQQLVCLLKGFTLCILTENIRNSAKGIIDCLIEQKISVFDCTPSQLDLLLNENILEKCRETLKVILVGGESIPDHMWHRLVQEKKIDIFNVYGPTECCVDSTCYLVNGSEYQTATIGQAIDNCNIHILDDQQQIVPIGAVGEIYISGYGVSRGYFNREELNKAHFLEYPTSGPKPAYLYKTGDKGYCLCDGNIRYIGRSDGQVKIRSHRIELSEISANLCRHPYIKDAIVMVNEATGYKKLIAYLILRDEGEFNPQDISDYLSNYLPQYMLPNQYMVLSEWPLTPNKKIDKNKLPLPDEIHEEGYNAVESQDKLERGLAEIMVKILKITKITAADNFMTLGGDSLRVMTLLAEIFSRFHTEIDFEEFFQKPTLGFLKEKILVTKGWDDSVQS